MEDAKVLILGIGSLGSRVAGCIAEQGIAGIACAAVDTDKIEIEKLPAGVEKILAGTDRSWKDGFGCGGNVLRGEQAVAPERQKIAALAENRSLVVVTAGLGGGTATGGIRTIASVLRTKGIPAVFMLTTPFSFESFSRRKAAESCIDELLPVTDVLIRLPGDLLFSVLSADTPAEEAYSLSCAELARSVLGICGILNSAHNVNADFAGFMELLRNRKSTCSFGVGISNSTVSLDPCGSAMQQMLESPFLGGTERITGADALIISICGGPTLLYADVKRVLENLSSMAPDVHQILSGFSIAPYMGNAVQILTIPVKYDEIAAAEEEAAKNAPGLSTLTLESKEETSPPARKRRKRGSKGQEDSGFEQGLLPLQNFAKGFFAGCEPSLWNGEDLDVPTFQRRNISIVKGGSTK